MSVTDSTSSLPTVTAITAAYNYAGFIARTLDSALEQDYPAHLLDIVVVDDGSSDDTPAVLADYERRYPERITVIRQDNAGYVAATNRAVAAAKGEVLAILDADDLWPADKTRRQVQVLLDNPEIGLVYCDTEIIDPYDKVRRPSLWKWLKMKPQRGTDAFADIMDTSGNVALASTIILRADLAPEVFPMPVAAPYVDWWVTARVAAVAGIEYLADVKVGYRQHGDNLTLGATGMQRVRETLKCAEVRRQLLIRGAADHLSDSELLAAWQAWEGAGLTAVSQAGSAYVSLPASSDEERSMAAAHIAAAERAIHDGEPARAFRERLLAVACDPYDVRSREWLHDLAWVAKDDDADADETPTIDPLADARGFVTLAYLDEIVAEPQILGIYANVVSADADATLAVAATGLGQSRALRLVHHAASELGLDLDQLPDVLLVADGGQRMKLELERRADALLTRRAGNLGKPILHPGRLEELRALAGELITTCAAA